MKALLMFEDRDFDPQGLLARKDRAPSSRRAQEEAALRQLLPWNAAALAQDLDLAVICKAMADGDEFLDNVAELALLLSLNDREPILYRQAVLSDCLDNAEIVRSIYAIALQAIEHERKNYLGFFSRYPSSILHRSREVMGTFVKLLRELRTIAEESAGKFTSKGFTRLFAMLQEELGDDYLAEVEAHLKEVRFRDGVLVSASLGRGNHGRDYVLRKPHPDDRSWMTKLLGPRAPSYTFHLHPRDEAGARALSELRDRGINLVAGALAQSTDHVLSFFQNLRAELAFYIGCLNLKGALDRLGEPICLPAPLQAGERKLSFAGLYDPSLALSLEHKVIGNEFDADGKSLCVITGANTGGKSTFLRSIGLAQLMMQAGMFVCAGQFSSELSNGIFTHYKREEDVSMQSGKWDEELGRMRAIIDHIKPNSLLLLNESFASTNEREGSEIARQIVDALLEAGVRIVFVTHLYSFARDAYENRSTGALFLRAERNEDGTRPFKLVEGKPLQTSYGEDLYREIFDARATDHCAA